MIAKLKSYKNGVHGEFFLSVVAELERLTTELASVREERDETKNVCKRMEQIIKDQKNTFVGAKAYWKDQEAGAFRQGAEDMRESTAGLVWEWHPVEGKVKLFNAIRALPLPERKGEKG